MKYAVSFTLNTDGDFYWEYVPVGMEPSIEEYSFKADFDTKDAEVKINKMFKYLLDNVQCDDWRKEILERLLAPVVLNCKNIERTIGGNYDGSYVRISYTEDDMIKIPCSRGFSSVVLKSIQNYEKKTQMEIYEILRKRLLNPLPSEQLYE